MPLGIKSALREPTSHPILCLTRFPYDIPQETVIPGWAYLPVGVRPLQSLRSHHGS